MNFVESPEAIEYINKLNAGRVSLPDDASPIEREILVNFKDRQERLKEIGNARSDAAKQIEELTVRHKQLNQEWDVMSGEVRANARILVSAEGGRRALVEAKPDLKADKETPDGKSNGESKTKPVKSPKPGRKPGAKSPPAMAPSTKPEAN